ncbi:hypothetical protein MANES_17G059650v8 [Manihot esculenta]|uniref:Uncharacterized protein n=1 Tax=Manihot esculenta TaxID=3983 RepID=A0ACB7G2X9_MANES|nr:hypothetical protein MANES_17G059650v8 [Manihot esculenta]
MTKTRMENRMEQVEGSVELLQEAVAATKLGQDQSRAELEQRFSRLESMIASLVKGKGTAEVGVSSGQTPEQQFQLNTSANKAISRPLLLEDAFSMAKKMEMPDFDGTDPVGCVARSEQFFEIQNIPEETKVPLALVSMEGAPLHWLRWLRQRNPLLTWE